MGVSDAVVVSDTVMVSEAVIEVDVSDVVAEVAEPDAVVPVETSGAVVEVEDSEETEDVEDVEMTSDDDNGALVEDVDVEDAELESTVLVDNTSEVAEPAEDTVAEAVSVDVDKESLVEVSTSWADVVEVDSECSPIVVVPPITEVGTVDDVVEGSPVDVVVVFTEGP